MKGRHAVEATVTQVWVRACRKKFSHDCGVARPCGHPESRAAPITGDLNILPFAQTPLDELQVASLGGR
jgi:hypothetical protein